jgi:integrase/recombinase XerD
MKSEPDLLDRWEADARIRGMAKITIDGYRWALKDFQKFSVARGRRLKDTEKMMLRTYIDDCRSRKLTTRTIGGRLGAISNFFEFLIFEGIRKDNPVHDVRKRYLSPYKSDSEKQTHQLISVVDAARLVDACMDVRDKAIMLLLFKTGIRRGELLTIEVDDINWSDQSILLKPKKKRSNRIVFFDDETAYILRRWLVTRDSRGPMDPALWISSWGKGIDYGGINYVIEKAALQCGLHDTTSPRMEDHFSAHCCRHWFTTHLLRAGMRREYIAWLRGDVSREAIDIYFHINPEDVRKAYIAHIPQLGI